MLFMEYDLTSASSYKERFLTDGNCNFHSKKNENFFLDFSAQYFFV